MKQFTTIPRLDVTEPSTWEMLRSVCLNNSYYEYLRYEIRRERDEIAELIRRSDEVLASNKALLERVANTRRPASRRHSPMV